MDMGLYRKCIDDMRGFDRQLKMLRFAAIGEPLLHRDIAEMVRYAKQAGVAQSVDIQRRAADAGAVGPADRRGPGPAADIRGGTVRGGLPEKCRAGDRF